MRLENEYLPPYSEEFNGRKVANPITFNWGDKIAPRIGGAWDITRRRQMEARRRFRYLLRRHEVQPGAGFLRRRLLVVACLQTGQPGGSRRTSSKKNPAAAGSLIVEYDNRTLPVNAQGEWEGVDPDIKPYTQREFSAVARSPTVVADGVRRPLCPQRPAEGH